MLERKYLEVCSGETLAYVKVGNGPRVMLYCHGNFSSSVNSINFFKGVSEEYTIICPDYRGFGESTYNTPFTCLKDLAKDSICLMKKLGYDKYYVVGHSLGGGVAMEVAIEATEHVIKLVLIAPTSVYGYPLFKQDADGKYLPFSSKEDLLTNPGFAVLHDIMQRRDAKAFAATLAGLRTGEVDMDAMVKAAEESVKERDLIGANFALATFNITNVPSLYGQGTGEYKKMTMPIFLATAGKDTIVFPFMNDTNVKTLGELNCVHKFYPESGHVIYDEATEEFFKDMHEFLK